jgi:hypothetical protein
MQLLYTALTSLGFMASIWSEAFVILNLPCLLLQGHVWLNDMRNGLSREMQTLGGLNYVLGLTLLALCIAKSLFRFQELVGAEILTTSQLLAFTTFTNYNIG